MSEETVCMYVVGLNTFFSGCNCLLRFTECIFASYSIFMGHKKTARVQCGRRARSFCRLSSELHHFTLASSLFWTKLNLTFLARSLLTCSPWYRRTRHWRAPSSHHQHELAEPPPPPPSLFLAFCCDLVTHAHAFSFVFFRWPSYRQKEWRAGVEKNGMIA